MTLYQISTAIRDVGEIWLIQHLEFGTCFRASVGRNQVRIVSPRPGKTPSVEVPAEKNSTLHLVSDARALHDFLRTLSQPRT